MLQTTKAQLRIQTTQTNNILQNKRPNILQLLKCYSIREIRSGVINILSVYQENPLYGCFNTLMYYDREKDEDILVTDEKGNRFKQQDLQQYGKIHFFKHDREIYDAIWTPSGNILMTVVNDGNILKITASSGKSEVQALMTNPGYLSLSDNNDVIYLVDNETDIYQTSDEGKSWRRLTVQITDGNKCIKFMKVSTEQSNDYWTLELVSKPSEKYYVLRQYVTNKREAGEIITAKDFQQYPSLGLNGTVSFDTFRYNNSAYFLFLSDYNTKKLNVYFINGQYQQLFSSAALSNHPLKLTVDRNKRRLFVALSNSTINKYYVNPEMLWKLDNYKELTECIIIG